MRAELKQFARRHAAAPVTLFWGRWYGAVKKRRARTALAAASRPSHPPYLPIGELDRLMTFGYRPPDVIRYDPEGLSQRAAAKIEELARTVPIEPGRRALELGCWDGMVAAALAGRQVASYALDVTPRGLDPRAKEAGIRAIVADAGAIPLAAHSFDLVYSFASFEHFPEPDHTIAEVARILRSGGYAHLSFGPLYFSPYGLHAYRQVPIPFCHLLFREEELHAWAEARRIPHAWPYVNGWSLAEYQRLFASVASIFETMSYVEHETGGVGTELIARYPGCFASRATTFREFLVTQIDVVLRKR